MQVVFAGGASAVGASCLAIEIAGQWIVVDAGVRVDRKADPLPDLALLEGKDVKAIFVTHAHADHIGALPLVHRAFPTAPIFASRATGLLMEVMLSDALKIMNRRAVEEMEIPLYPPELVGSMLNQVRPLPVGENFTLSQLPNLTIHASRAGHIAGAVSFAFSASDGTIVVSGDISSTPQRTVLGATPPPVDHCDLLIMESTYGSRLHPNRQGEELRLSQAVAESIARGGHCLIPCFGLGRGQELLLILQAAQEKGHIPDFPIFVDGLVRRVCNTYLLLPEALPPVLQRQIRKGYLPFTGRNVHFVRDERERERILAGPPACFLSSSGMLTGGPSVWYAQRLAAQENASILITGYQDEEAPGKRLLDLADQKNSTLELNGMTVQIRCHVAKYSLSAHADGGELAAYASVLKPRRVALVHGDADARQALRRLISDTEVLLPDNSSSITTQSRKNLPGKQATALPTLPVDIGQGRELSLDTLPELWRAVSTIPSLRIVTARELASIWYGEVTENTTAEVLNILDSEWEQRYFIHQQALEEAYRVRGQSEEEPGDFLADLVGKVLLVEIAPNSTKPVICTGIEPGGRIRAQHPKGVDFVRSRYPFSAIIDVLGEQTDEMLDGRFGAAEGLEDLVRAARRLRRRLSAHELARQCKEDATYTLGDLCQLAGVSATSLEDRLAIAKILYKNPLIFLPERTLLEGEGLALYSLAPEWTEILEEPEELPPPDQNWLQEVITQHLGHAEDLYKRSIDPDSGDITLAFHFPATAQHQYAQEIAAIAEDTGVTVNIAPQPHQGELVHAARAALPTGLSERGFPSVYHDSHIIQVKSVGEATPEAIAAAQQSFFERTSWQLELDIQRATTRSTPLQSVQTTQSALERTIPKQAHVDQHAAILTAQGLLRGLPGFVKVGAEPNRWLLHLRFHFPEVARQNFADIFSDIEEQTGWEVRVQEGTNQEALVQMARSVLPEGLTPLHAPSLYHNQQAILVQCKGSAPQKEILAAQERFGAETGWQLTITIPGSRTEQEQLPRMTQGDALAHITAALRGDTELSRIGADIRLKIFWLHFYFPKKAQERYNALLPQLEEETGWRVYLHPHAQRKALIDVVQRLLPETTSLVGKKSLHEETHTLLLTSTNLPDAEALEEIERQFMEKTGWELQLEQAAEEDLVD